MATLTYNSVVLDVLETRQCDRQVRYSEDKTEMLWEDWTIAVVAIWNRDVAGTQNPASPLLNDVAIRLALMTPNRILTYTMTGRAAPGGGVVTQTMLTAPEPAGAGGALSACDSENGPTPLFCTVSKVVGDATTFMVSYAIKASIRDCTGTVLPLVSNRWQMSDQFDRQNYGTTRVVTGRAVFDVGVLRTLNQFADRLRPNFLFPVPVDFQRQTVNVTASPDGTSIDYTVIDVEQMIQVNAFSSTTAVESQVATMDVAYTQGYVDPFYSGSLASTLTSLSNYKFAKPDGRETKGPVGAANPPQKNGILGGGLRGAGGVASLLGLVLDITKNAFPTFEEEVSVNVTGNKYSTKGRLFALALSTANRIIPRRRGGVLGDGKLIVTYDMVGKTVTFTKATSYGGLSSVIGGSVDAGYDIMMFPTATPVPESVRGAGYTSIPFVAPVPPQLPDAGGIVLGTTFTTDPANLQNPFPPGDGTAVNEPLNRLGTVGSYLIQMVTQFLTSPCASPTYPGATPEANLPGFAN